MGSWQFCNSFREIHPNGPDALDLAIDVNCFQIGHNAFFYGIEGQILAGTSYLTDEQAHCVLVETPAAATHIEDAALASFVVVERASPAQSVEPFLVMEYK